MWKCSNKCIALYQLIFHTQTWFHPKGNGYVEVPIPDILSFSSPDNDAAITFINSTTMNGVVFQHNRAFDVIASANLLVVWQHTAQNVLGITTQLLTNTPRTCTMLAAPGASQSELRCRPVCCCSFKPTTPWTRDTRTAFINFRHWGVSNVIKRPGSEGGLETFPTYELIVWWTAKLGKI